jgi:hypothetical protein
MHWTKDERGEPWPVYTEEEAQRIARAAWGVHALLPHPDDVRDAEHAASLREFHRAMTCSPRRESP